MSLVMLDVEATEEASRYNTYQALTTYFPSLIIYSRPVTERVSVQLVHMFLIVLVVY